MGDGPDYCKTCRASRDSQDPCEGCPEPEIIPENVPIIRLWDLASTQWFTDFGRPIGLRYEGVRAAAELAGIEVTPDRFHLLRSMESELLVILREQDAERKNTDRPRR